MTPEDILSRILYRDALMLVINKPPGIPVHAGSGKLEPLEKHFEHLKFGLPRTPALAHRLDKDTSGCLVLGRHTQALRRLSDLFAKGKIKKTYWAIVKGHPPQTDGVIDLPLSPQSDKTYHWRTKVDPLGKPAITNYLTLGQTDEFTWLELSPETGRTHQLRVHCAAIGCPILGDSIYGEDNDSPLQLHAQSLEIPLYPKKDPILVEALPPLHMEEVIAKLGMS